MKLTIAKKLLLTVLLVTAAVVGLIVALTRYSIGTGFSRYLANAELASLAPVARHLEGLYVREGNWDFARRNPAAVWHDIEFNGAVPPGWSGGAPPPFSPERPLPGPGWGAGMPAIDPEAPGMPQTANPAATQTANPAATQTANPADTAGTNPAAVTVDPATSADSAPGTSPASTPNSGSTPNPVIGKPADIVKPGDSSIAPDSTIRQPGDPPIGQPADPVGAPDSAITAPADSAKAPSPADQGVIGHAMHPRPTRQPPHVMDLLHRTAVLDAQGRIVCGNPRALLGQEHLTLMHDGKAIGELRVAPEPYLTDRMEQDFVKEQDRNLWLIAAAAIALASLAAIGLSRDILGAIRSIVAGTRELASGHFSSRVNMQRGDELGQLAEDLNNLAARLEQQRNVQRQWMVDTSHELRTPIAILRAQIEALQDGVQPASPRTLSVLHSEVMALAKLVSDLHELARFDLGELKLNMVPVDVLGALQESVESFQERFREKKIEIDADSLDNGIYVINADTTKLKQLFANLLENSLRYTGEGGHLTIDYKPTPEAVTLQFDDSEPGVPDELLPQLFDRFFRAEQSRSRSLGGSGLGLAICKAIVDDHAGMITAEKSPLGGVRVLVRLPAKNNGNESGTADRKQTGAAEKKQSGATDKKQGGATDKKQSRMADKKGGLQEKKRGDGR